LKTRRDRSTGLGLTILNILRPLLKITMIPLIMIISIRIRIIE